MTDVSYIFTKGHSMWPALSAKKRTLLEYVPATGQEKRGDIVLYPMEGGLLCCHRILRVCEKEYLVAGDNLWQSERIPKADVQSRVVRFYRQNKWLKHRYGKGKWTDLRHPLWRLYAWVWTGTFPLRKPFLWVRDQLRK